MGEVVGRTHNTKNPEWHYPSPNSVNETILKSVCSRRVLDNEKTHSHIHSFILNSNVLIPFLCRMDEVERNGERKYRLYQF